MRLAAVPLWLVLALLAACGHGNSDEVAAVREAFQTYQEALARRDGALAASVIDEETLAYYDDTRKLALNAPAERVRELPLSARLQVLAMRHLFDFRTASGIDGADVISFLVNEGWVGSSHRVSMSSLGQITLKGDRADGVLLVKGEPTPISWRFRKEGRHWKVNLTSMMALADRALGQAIARTSLTQDEFVIKVIESRTLRQVSDRVWQPLSAVSGLGR